MKTFALIIIVLSCCTLHSQAQIQASSFDFEVPPTNVYLSYRFANVHPSYHILNSLAQIRIESVDYDVPQLRISPTGPQVIVRIDSNDYELAGLSSTDTLSHSTTWVYNIDRTWIKKIFRDVASLDKYGYQVRKSAVIIRLRTDHIEDFLEGKKVDSPMKIKTYN